MTNIDLAIRKINAAKDPLILVHTEVALAQYFYLLKRDGTVRLAEEQDYRGLPIQGLRGLEFQIDSDLDYYMMEFAQNSHINFCPTNSGAEKSNLLIGYEATIEYLKKVGQWHQGINFQQKLDACIAAVDLFINDKLKP